MSGSLGSRFAGKVAFITGAARGQGRSHAVRLAREGADIIAVDALKDYDSIAYPMSTRENLDETIALVERTGQRIVAVRADVRELAELAAAVDHGVTEFGRLDVVIANAGVCSVQAWNEVTPEIWRDTIDTNLTGVWNTMVATAPHLIEGGGGSIIAISSAAGLKGLPFYGPYVAAKHAVVGLARSMANELSEYGIRVNTIHPAGVRTAMSAGLEMGDVLAAHPQLGPIFMNSLPMELVEPDDVSDAVLFLASDESKFITGLAMTVDGGNTIR
jgi:SDR family mycofactocin-dependent oxidoreductase